MRELFCIQETLFFLLCVLETAVSWIKLVNLKDFTSSAC